MTRLKLTAAFAGSNMPCVTLPPGSHNAKCAIAQVRPGSKTECHRL
jgi:hypothetical protein